MIGAFVAGVLVAGCGSTPGPAPVVPPDTAGPAPATSTAALAPPAEPARAGAPTSTPAGAVVPLGNAPEGIVVGQSGTAAVAVRGPDAIVLVDAATGAERSRIPMPSAARHLSLTGPDGPVLVALEGTDELLELSLADGQVLSRVGGVGRNPHEATTTADGTIVVTSEGGGGVVFVRDGHVVATLPAGPPQPGGVAAVGDYVAVADVRGNGVWAYDAVSRREVAHAPVGVKLTHAVALFGELAAFADTDGGAVLIERIDPRISEVARIEAPGKPYGLAYDPGRRRLYITLTESNRLRVVDVADPAHSRLLGDVPTVRQPNSVAVVEDTGTVLVTGSRADGGGSLQIVPVGLLP